jgi:hypothetical protein
MKIKAIKMYQSVTFEKRAETHFTVLPVTNKPSTKLEFHKDIMCVSVKSDRDHILVPLTNICSIELWIDDECNSYLERADAVKKVKGTLKDHEIK